jgi:hypothetical protein
MIRFSLHCANDHAFEGWFRDGASFERQSAEMSISCPDCGNSDVRKAMMAPAIVRSASRAVALPPVPTPATAAPTSADLPAHGKAAMMVAVLRKVREHVEAHFENVGDRFPEEARRIHYGDAAEREIFGQATMQEAKELHDEGIAVRPLPELPKLDS